jgi:hypothetical protein
VILRIFIRAHADGRKLIKADSIGTQLALGNNTNPHAPACPVHPNPFPFRLLPPKFLIGRARTTARTSFEPHVINRGTERSKRIRRFPLFSERKSLLALSPFDALFFKASFS